MRTDRTATDPISRRPACVAAPTTTASAFTSSASRAISVAGSPPRTFGVVAPISGVTRPSPAAQRRDLVAGLERLITLVRVLTPSGEISLTAASTLATLARSRPHRLSDLATREGVTQPAMTQLVSRLERDGLAARHGSPGDRRVVLVHITPAGERLLARHRERRAAELADLLHGLSPEDQAALAAAPPALDRLVELGCTASARASA